jgi:hypothetical protein
LGDPYLVLQGWHPTTDATLANVLGFDALSAYAVAGGSPSGAPFHDVVTAATEGWEQARSTGMQVVPWLSAGWDPRPRIETPTPWVTYSNEYYLAPTPEELSRHTAAGLAWTRTWPWSCPADVVLLYAWNEHDEGGWVCPTLDGAGSDTTRVMAMRSAVDRFASLVPVPNFSFESPKVTDGWYVIPSGGPHAFGWTTLAPPGTYLLADVKAAHFTSAADGEQALLLSNAPAIEASLDPTKPKVTYRLTFASLTGNYPGDTAGTFRVEMFDGTKLLATGNFATPGSPDVWETHVLETGTGTLVEGDLRVRFVSTSGMPWLDDVRIVME